MGGLDGGRGYRTGAEAVQMDQESSVEDKACKGAGESPAFAGDSFFYVSTGAIRIARRSCLYLAPRHVRYRPDALHGDGFLFAGHEAAPAAITCLRIHLCLELLRAR